MDLILWRHAEAKEGEPDMERVLTGRGRKQARRTGEWLNRHLPDNCRILVSPALRTLQTAQELGRKFRIEARLAPGAMASELLAAAHWPLAKEAVLLIGHQPTLGQLCARLMAGAEQDWDVRKAGIWWFSQHETGDADSIYLKAVMGPELLNN